MENVENKLMLKILTNVNWQECRVSQKVANVLLISEQYTILETLFLSIGSHTKKSLGALRVGIWGVMI